MVFHRRGRLSLSHPCWVLGIILVLTAITPLAGESLPDPLRIPGVCDAGDLDGTGTVVLATDATAGPAFLAGKEPVLSVVAMFEPASVTTPRSVFLQAALGRSPPF
jgi:hypothetical protein